MSQRSEALRKYWAAVKAAAKIERKPVAAIRTQYRLNPQKRSVLQKTARSKNPAKAYRIIEYRSHIDNIKQRFKIDERMARDFYKTVVRANQATIERRLVDPENIPGWITEAELQKFRKLKTGKNAGKIAVWYDNLLGRPLDTKSFFRLRDDMRVSRITGRLIDRGYTRNELRKLKKYIPKEKWASVKRGEKLTFTIDEAREIARKITADLKAKKKGTYEKLTETLGVS